MDKDTERLEKISIALSRQNITFERIPGVPGKDVKHDDRLTDFCNKFCADSVKGCALSHRNIWDIAYERGYESILVFEDDAIIPDDLSVQLQRIWHKRPDDYDIISLGSNGFGVEENNMYSTFNKITNMKPQPYNDSFKIAKGQFGFYALFISKSGINKFRSNKINGHIDGEVTFWSWAQKTPFKFYITYPLEVKPNMEIISNNSSKTQYPSCILYFLQKIQMSHINDATYFYNISLYKISSLKLTSGLIFFFLITLFIPPIYKYIVLAYLIGELIVTPSLSEASPYFTVWTAAFLISYPFYKNNLRQMRFLIARGSKNMKHFFSNLK